MIFFLYHGDVLVLKSGFSGRGRRRHSKGRRRLLSLYRSRGRRRVSDHTRERRACYDSSHFPSNHASSSFICAFNFRRILERRRRLGRCNEVTGKTHAVTECRVICLCDEVVEKVRAFCIKQIIYSKSIIATDAMQAFNIARHLRSKS